MDRAGYECENHLNREVLGPFTMWRNREGHALGTSHTAGPTTAVTTLVRVTAAPPRPNPPVCHTFVGEQAEGAEYNHPLIAMGPTSTDSPSVYLTSHGLRIFKKWHL